MADFSRAVHGVAIAVNLLCDVCRLGESVDALIKAKDEEDSSVLETATVVNALALVGFSIAEIGGLLSGQKSEILQRLKEIELIPRMIHLPLQLTSQIKRVAMDVDGPKSSELRAMIRIIERGLVEPIADISRTAISASAYYEQHFIDMTPEQLKDAKRPIYEIDNSGDEPSYKIVGYRPVDIEECKENLASLRIGFDAATVVRVAAQKGITEIVVCDLGRPTLQRLAAFFGRATPEAGAGGRRGGGGAGGMGYAARPRAAERPEQPAQQAEERDLNLVSYPTIPEPLHGDQVFRQYICPITRCPVRDPVRDPTNWRHNSL